MKLFSKKKQGESPKASSALKRIGDTMKYLEIKKTGSKKRSSLCQQ